MILYAVISTVLSSIVADLSIGDDYPWVVNSYMLASLVVQPRYESRYRFQSIS